MKKLCMILTLLLVLTISGCSDKNSYKDPNDKTSKDDDRAEATSKYDIVKETFINDKIIINYPQISNLNDEDKQKKINELIKVEALKIQEDYKVDISNLNLNMDYEIMYNGSDLLSIYYSGLAMIKNAAYPINEINTTNIDMEKVQLLTLSDVVTIDDDFINKFKEGKYKAYSEDLNLESAGALNDALNSFEGNELMENFKQNIANFYFTNDSLVVSADVIHVMGDHLEMELKYDDLGDLLLINPAK